MIARARSLWRRLRWRPDGALWGFLVALLPWLLVVVVALLMWGCTGSAALVEQLAKDPASNCVVLSTPYGGLLVARGTPGVRVNLAGGTCSIDGGPVR
jgi:hypothetical protein